ncbi:hypothetical protein VZT92_021021 [Zoarces viviparus]|uniref:Uncharacterized protein n=1 Tax=Zoarces viviparus TaxID=48416 RepID=A0AAW1EG81_ZOAVI
MKKNTLHVSALQQATLNVSDGEPESLRVTTQASAGSTSGGGKMERATSGARAPVNGCEIAGCQADPDAVMRYYLL